MPEGLLSVVAVLSVGYLLLVFELFVPGGVLGIIGLGVIGLGCFQAFSLGTVWGIAAVVSSLGVTAAGIVLFNRSRAGRDLVLDNEGSRTWKAPGEDLSGWVGRQGTTLSPLRPAGLAEFDGRRLDVVSDSEFIDQQVAVRVVEVEGRRVLVEALEAPTTAEPVADLPVEGP